MNTKQRNSNIELLRILSMVGVIILHYNNPEIGKGISLVSNNINRFILYFLESICVCAVDLFILISGYFLCRSTKRKSSKIIELVVQVMIFSFILYFLKIFLGEETLTAKGLIITLIPSNWFVILYCTLYMISPYLNCLLEHLNVKEKKKLVLLLCCIFAIWPTIVDLSGELLGKQWIGLSSVGMYGSQWGYSIVNFILLYIIGAYLYYKEENINNYNKKQLICGLIGIALIITGWAYLNEKSMIFIERSAWEYCNPFVILEAILIFLLFKNIKTFYSKIINNLAKACFTVFLLQNTFIRKLHIVQYIDGNGIILLMHLIFNSALIYIICWCVYYIYNKISKLFLKLISK